MTSPHPSGHAIGLSVQVLAGSLPSQRAVISVAGHPYELAGSLSSALVPGPWQLAGFSEGYAVFTLRKPPEPITAATASGRRLPVQVISSTTKSEEIRLDAPASSTVIRSVAWDSGWTATVSVNGGKAQKITVRRLRSRAAGPHPTRRRCGLVPLPTTAPLAGKRSQPGCGGAALGAARRVVDAPPRAPWEPGARGARCAGRGGGRVAGSGAGARRLSRLSRRRPVSRKGAPGSGGTRRLPRPTSLRPRSRRPRARVPLVQA